MSRNVPAGELDLILWVIGEYPQGIGIADLEIELSKHLPKKLHRRTLQRRLSLLLSDKRIMTEGESIALVYKPAPIVISPESTSQFVSSTSIGIGSYIPISKEGCLIRDHVRQPLSRRNPVGYYRPFLEDYEPGITFYLPEALRIQFHEMGRTPANERPAGTYVREIMNRLLIDLSWASSRLEGNTYSRLDTERLIEFGQTAEGKDLQETQMILNHKRAIEMLVDEIEQVGFNPFTFFNLHAILSENLLSDEDACGRLRRRPVKISGTIFEPLAMPQVLEDCFRQMLQKADSIPDPFEQAFFVMVQLPYLQPFEDVNKRVSRLGANISLFRDNLCPLSFIDVPEKAYVDGTLGVYELNQIDLLRDVFTWAYERSCQRYLAITQTMAEPDPMRIRYREALIYAVQKIVRSGNPPSAQNIQILTDELVPERDQAAFNNMVKDALQRLHEGSVARYRLKLSEYLEWMPVRNEFDS
jgi:hypothetical protein